MKKYSCAIVGLGQVGQLFDLDKLRTGIWTHFSAYERLTEQFELVAVCDPDQSKLEIAAERKSTLSLYKSLDDMLSNEQIDVISLCSPPQYHSDQILASCKKVKAIICEKPLGVGLDECSRAVKECDDNGTVLVVNYYKRLDGCIPQVKKLMAAIGELSYINAYYSGPLDAVGSHAINLLQYFAGDLEFKTASCGAAELYNAQFKFAGGKIAQLVCTGPRESLIFELDIIGASGRIRVLDNCSHFEFYRFEESSRYAGYEELEQQDIEQEEAQERFLPMFEEVYKALNNETLKLSFAGKDALQTQQLINQISGITADVS